MRKAVEEPMVTLPPVPPRLDPEAVELGAAYRAAFLTEQRKAIKEISDVTPLSMGVTTLKGLVDTIIPKGTKLPTKRHRIYRTPYNNQSCQ
ncbi:hypothetical protein GWI33_003150 [Rhynchophorus ferrugineus]|uniref:Uncharacterized protein n=1 Tax=Rhynchophorus ferrugineus TaxID=354439 RepID=A0A834HJF3_RHYFE|nr:hypothetical protein GWI33_003150 [Rhynchophorus ferrugineus]